VRDCYQCGNCSGSCPAAFTFDYMPNQLMRMLQVGLVDKVLDSTAIQLCVQCLTCTARCPRNIDIAGIFEDLKTVARAQGRDLPEHAKTFNQAFMGAVARYGRLPELYMMGMFYLGTMNPKMAMGDVGLAVPMVSKGKMGILPHKAKGADEVGRIYKKTLAAAKAREKAFAEAVASESAAMAAKAAPAPAAPCAVCGPGGEPATPGATAESEVAV
jgi:heterodisulfide reductase subunit C